MDKEEFLNFLSQTTKEFKEYLELKEKFMKDLADQLNSFAHNRFASLSTNKTNSEKVKQEAEICAMMAIDSYNITLELINEDTEYVPEFRAPKLKTRSESEKELNDFLKIIPEEDYEYAAEIHWADYKHEIVVQQVKIDIHNLIKSLIVKYFEEAILEFSSQYFHHLDDHTFIHATFPFIDAVFECIDESEF